MRIDINQLVRPHLKKLNPYFSARQEFDGPADIFLDANENAMGSPVEEVLNRYPDPLQVDLKSAVSKFKSVSPKQIAFGNGSDELIDQLIRIFCNPSSDNILVCTPGFKMYEVAAAMNDIVVKKVSLTVSFQLDVEAILSAVDEHTKIIFLCSPNNPLGNDLDPELIKKVLDSFKGIVVLDEAYIDFSSQPSLLKLLPEYNNLVVLQTFSKAWGLAGLRMGIAFASEAIINWLMMIKMPYNISELTQKLAMDALQNEGRITQWIKEIVSGRNLLSVQLSELRCVEKVFDSSANFLLVKVKDAASMYEYLLRKKIIVRNQTKQHMLHNCLRITIGTEEESAQLIQALKNYRP